MKGIFGRPEGAAASAGRRELAELKKKIVEAKADLSRLQADIAVAESRLATNQTVQILEANEQLLFAALRAQTDADLATDALVVVTRSAELDTLTELPNRVRLFDRFAQAMATAKRHKTRLALLFIDLNKFKQINDTLGHAVGDEVLKRAAHCFESVVRDADTVSRYGGDEFVILLTDVTHAADAALTAVKLIASLGAPWRVGGYVLRLTASIGISIYPGDGDDAVSLIDRADAAMYSAKRQGLGSYVFHGRESLGERGLRTPTLASLQQPASDFRLALAERERRSAQMQAANEQLLLAAFGATELLAAADRAQRQRTGWLDLLAHELRHPLAPRSAAALLGQRGNGAPVLRRLQAVIERQAAESARLLGVRLDLSRPGTGELRLAMQPVDLLGVVDAAVEACRPALDTRLQHLLVEASPVALQVDADPAALTLIFSKLLDNASKYTPEGGEIRFSLEGAGERVLLTVADNGIGIAAEVLPAVFEPFVQDPRAIGFSGVGLGIGLAVVRKAVEAHGGSVVASSAGAGLGSRFVVGLPWTDAAPPAS